MLIPPYPLPPPPPPTHHTWLRVVVVVVVCPSLLLLKGGCSESQLLLLLLLLLYRSYSQVLLEHESSCSCHGGDAPVVTRVEVVTTWHSQCCSVHSVHNICCQQSNLKRQLIKQRNKNGFTFYNCFGQNLTFYKDFERQVFILDLDELL